MTLACIANRMFYFACALAMLGASAWMLVRDGGPAYWWVVLAGSAGSLGCGVASMFRSNR